MNKNIIDKIKYLIFKLNCAEEDEDWCMVIDVRVELKKLIKDIEENTNE